jgi:hypothetical protein
VRASLSLNPFSSSFLSVSTFRTTTRMDKMAAGVGRKAPPARGLAPDDDLPLEYWQALLADPRADAGQADRRAAVVAN